MALDHGVLNVPLSKRGDINAELDQYKAQQARDARAAAKAQAAETRKLRKKANALIDNASNELVMRVAARAGTSVADVRTYLRGEAHWNPAFVIRALGGAA